MYALHNMINVAIEEWVITVESQGELFTLTWRVIECIREMIIKLELKEWMAFWVAFHRSKIKSSKGKPGVFGGEGEKLNHRKIKKMKVRDDLGNVEKRWKDL